MKKKKALNISKRLGIALSLGLGIWTLGMQDVDAAGSRWDFNYTGSQQSWVAPVSGKYLVEVWGSQGYTRSSGGGKGGYSSAVINFDANTTSYVYVGGQNGFNGGGAPSTLAGGYGGGGTDLRVDGNTLNHRFIVAGGGGGEFNGVPGAGGGTTGGTASFRGTQYGGTQSSGGYSSRNGSPGYFGQGGNAYYGGGASGGGGGWYGGAGGSTDYSAYYDADDDSGAGGSGYVLTASSYKPSGYAVGAKYYTTESSLISGGETMPAPNGGTQVGHSGNGFARITQLTVPPILNATPSTASWTTEDVTIAYDVQKGDHNLRELRLPNGTVTTDFSGTYKVTTNGTYTFKSTDVNGNESVKDVVVANIDRTAPTANLTAASPANGRVVLSLSSIADTVSGVKSITLPNGTAVTGTSYNYTVFENGVYEFLITDNAGNESLKSIEVKTLNSNNLEWAYTYNGTIDSFVVPRSGKYKLETWGAEGGRGTSGYNAGKGAYAVSVVNLNKNDWLKVLVGQQGNNYNSSTGSGGGGSYISTLGNTPLSVAGGGGGAYGNNYSGTYYHGQPTQQVAQFSPYTQQQSVGQGGFAGYNGWSYPSTAGAGGGFYGDGMANSYSGGGSGGYAFVNGGGVGKGYTTGIHGGFGGGGGTAYVGGGGGGYTGGHAGTGHTGSYHTGGGGGSYYTGAEGFAKGGWEPMPNQSGGTQVGQSGNGFVKITQVVNPPAITITPTKTGWTNETYALSLSVAKGDNAFKELSFPNGQKTTSMTSEYLVDANGTYTFTAYDEFGNLSTQSITVSNFDKTAPTGTLTPNTTAWTTGNVVLNLTGLADVGSGLKNITLPNGTVVTGTSASYTVTENGTYTFTATDNIGNTKEFTQVVTNIDRDLPDATIEYDGSNPASGLRIKVTGTDPTSSVRYITLPNGSRVSASSYAYPVTTAGNYSFTLEDMIGNRKTVTATVEAPDWTVERDKLDILVTVNSRYTNAPVTTRSQDGRTWTAQTFRIPILKNETFTFTTNDGGVVSTAKSLTIDNYYQLARPQVDITFDQKWTKGTVVLNVSVYNFDGRPIESTQLPDGTVTNQSNFTYTVSENGVYTFIARDEEGRLGFNSIQVANIDEKSPTIQLVSPGDWTNKDVPVDIQITNN